MQQLLGIRLLSFMLPTAFWSGEQSPIQSPQRAFLGFCLLLALVLVYLLQRQANLRRLKQQLFETQTALAAAERDAGIQVFQALPDLSQFRDILAMEFRSAASSGTHLAGAVLTVPDASPETIGRMTSLLRGLLRRGESLYRISDKGVGVVLPEMKLSDVASFVEQVRTLSGIQKERIEASLWTCPLD